MIKVGVAGCGKIAQTRHLPEYADNKNCQIVGVFDQNTTRSNEIALKYNTKVYKTYEEMLADKDIDAISVCVANNAHCEYTVKALEAGKHVLCEKPMATTLEECEKMVRVSEETGKFLMIGHNQRFTKSHVYAKNLIQQNVIGKVLTFRTSFGHGGPEAWAIDVNNNWFFDKSLATFGAIADLGIHKTDLIQFLTGQRVTEVSAFIGTLDKRDEKGELINVDDNTICIYKLSEGAVGTMIASWTYYGEEDNSTVLYGDKGVMHIYDDPDYSIWIEYKNGEKVFYQIDQIQTNIKQTKSGIIDSWIDCLIQNKPPEISGKDALNSMKAIFAAIESSKEKRTIIVE